MITGVIKSVEFGHVIVAGRAIQSVGSVLIDRYALFDALVALMHEISFNDITNIFEVIGCGHEVDEIERQHGLLAEAAAHTLGEDRVLTEELIPGRIRVLFLAVPADPDGDSPPPSPGPRIPGPSAHHAKAACKQTTTCN